MQQQHAEKCASLTKHLYSGDRRNGPYGDKMMPCDCDGYHTFDELYDHRITLYIALCRTIKDFIYTGRYQIVWRSKYHSDGELCFGTGTQFILGIGKDKYGQISYHIPIERWCETNFAETFDKAPGWDGHTSDDVLERIKRL